MDALRGFLDLEMSVHGWLALGLTAVGVVALNLGLMALARKPWNGEYHPDRDGDDSR